MNRKVALMCGSILSLVAAAPALADRDHGRRGDDRGRHWTHDRRDDCGPRRVVRCEPARVVCAPAPVCCPVPVCRPAPVCYSVPDCRPVTVCRPVIQPWPACFSGLSFSIRF